MLELVIPSRSPIARAFAAGAALTLLLAGCDGGGGDTSGGATTSTTQVSACSGDPRAEVYKVGMQGSSADGAITITFEDADPSPPAKGNNTWIVTIVDAAGKPVNDAAIETRSYMPDHGHESAVKATATSMGSDGTYEIKPINLFMPGVWEITLTVTPAGGAPAAVKFTFCIAG